MKKVCLIKEKDPKMGLKLHFYQTAIQKLFKRLIVQD